MSQQPRDVDLAPVFWCGRSWEALVDRRDDVFQHALALRTVTEANWRQVVSEFLTFFDDTGIALFRDEEVWIFRSLKPTPRVVLDALEGHIAISSLTQALILEAQVGCVDLCVVHRLGEVLENHLLMEEEAIRPLVTRPLTVAP